MTYAQFFHACGKQGREASAKPLGFNLPAKPVGFEHPPDERRETNRLLEMFSLETPAESDIERETD